MTQTLFTNISIFDGSGKKSYRGEGSGPGQPHQEGGQGQEAHRAERCGRGGRRRRNAHAGPRQRSLPHRLFGRGDVPLLPRRYAARGEHADHDAARPDPVRPRLHRPGLRRDRQDPHGHRDPQRGQRRSDRGAAHPRRVARAHGHRRPRRCAPAPHVPRGILDHLRRRGAVPPGPRGCSAAKASTSSRSCRRATSSFTPTAGATRP